MKKNRFKILRFINSHKNWKKILTKPPYNLMIREFDGYTLIKYSQIFSDLSNDIVKEARGFIIKKEGNKYKFVCVPFTKFFCLKDPNAKQDVIKLYHRKKWLIEEKIDGSLIKLWFDDNKWHVSTSGTIHAVDAEVQFKTEQINTFKDLFDVASKDKIDYNKLDKSYTYMFELVGIENKVIVPYNIEDIYYLGRRNNYTLNEVSYFDDDCVGVEKCKRPRCRIVDVNINPKKMMSKLYNDVNLLDKSNEHFEGYVVSDLSLKTRIKMKSNQYMELFHQKGNGVFTPRKILLMILDSKDDDIISSFPEYRVQFDKVRNQFINWVNLVKTELNYMQDNQWETKKDFAEWAKTTSCPTIMFSAYGKDYISDDWIEKKIKEINIDKLIEYIENKEREDV